MIRTSIAAAAVCCLAQLGTAQVTTEVLTTGAARPTFLTHAGDGSGRLFILEQNGAIRIHKDGALLATPFLDLNPLIPNVGGQDERGLLGLAFHPDYANNGKFYVNYINLSNNTVIAEYQVFPGLPDLANPGTARTLLTITQPFTNHNGGWLGFGPDGYLYIATGDGGSGGDPGNRAQNLSVHLGKLLRIDVDGNNSSNGQYGIPADNPFLGVAGAQPEIWAYGLRNPWRTSFDTNSGDLWIADVGQNAIEEVNHTDASSAGAENYGWRCYEGNNAFNLTGCAPANTMTFPVHTYNHTLGRCSITGGYVYRGCAMPDLDGQYLFGDFCGGQIYALDPSNGNSVVQIGDPGSGLSSFGQDEDGEVYVAFLFTNTIYKLVPTTFPDDNMNGIPDTCETLGCNPADLAEPFGSLDFSDVVAFLSAFGASEPAADLAEPFGQWDFSDVVAFLAAFGAGCP